MIKSWKKEDEKREKGWEKKKKIENAAKKDDEERAAFQPIFWKLFPFGSLRSFERKPEPGPRFQESYKF